MTVGRASRGSRYAALADGASAPTPITFEAEAEKPTRAAPPEEGGRRPGGRTGRSRRVAGRRGCGGARPRPSQMRAEAGRSRSGAPPKKKRTRRGTRGGRSRKKPGATAVTEVTVETEAATPDETDGRPAAPRIHVPPVELASGGKDDAPVAEEVVAVALGENGEAATADDEAAEADGQPKRKRSRRGSRGGRKRRKPAANGDQAQDADAARRRGGRLSRRNVDGETARVRSDVGVDRGLRRRKAVVAGIMLRLCGPRVRFDLRGTP